MPPFDETDLEALYEKLEKPVYNVVYRWVWDREEARDLTQEAFVRLWRMRAKIHDGAVEPLLYKIALNLARSALRRRRVLAWIPLGPSVPSPVARDDPAGDFAQDEERARVRAAVSALPNDLRQVILLCEFSGMSYGQISEVLSIPEGTVGSRRNRALKRLKEDLERS